MNYLRACGDILRVFRLRAELDRTLSDLAVINDRMLDASQTILRLKAELEQSKAEAAAISTVLEANTNELARVTNEADTHRRCGRLVFAGTFMDEDGLMPNVTSFLRGVTPQDSSVLALDFAAYGAISWNRHFSEQVIEIRRICRNFAVHGRPVRMYFNDERTNRDVIERQFPDDNWPDWYRKSAGKLHDWVQSSIFQELAVRDGVATVDLLKVARTGVTFFTRRMFIDTFLEFNERLIELYTEELRDMPVRRVHFIPLHGWFVNRRDGSAEGIIGIADSKAVWNEPAFSVSGGAAHRIAEFFESMLAQ